MRSEDEQQGTVFSYVGLEERVPKDHPLRAMRQMTDAALKGMDADIGRLYARMGRPSIPPSACCERSCCRCSIRSAPSGS